VAADETKIDINSTEHYVWAADCETLKVLHVDISPGRSSLDALLFLREVLSTRMDKLTQYLRAF
jgi:putative transposase